MRPSYGRVSRFGAMTIAWTMDKLGPMARTADDCGLVLSVIAGHDPQDHDSLPKGVAEFQYPRGERTSAGSLRVGRLTNVWRETEPGLESAVNESPAKMFTVAVDESVTGVPGAVVETK